MSIAIFNDHKHKGYATEAIKIIQQEYPGTILANINPNNHESIQFFTSKFGAKLIQHTYLLEESQNERTSSNDR